MDQVGIQARTGKDADSPIKPLWRMARVLQRFPRALEEMPVLGVHDRRIFGTEAEERCVEQRHILQHRGHLHVVRI